MRKKSTKLSIKLLVVIDTNILISTLLWGGELAKIFDLYKENKILLLVSPELISEIFKVLKRFKYSEEKLLELKDLFEKQSIKISPKSSVKICRDPEDNFILDLCLAGKADYLITGDQDLLILKKVKKTKIVLPKEFLKICL